MSRDGISFSTSGDRSSQLPLFRPEPDFALVPTQGTDKYVINNERTGLSALAPKGFLPAKKDKLDDDNRRFIILGNEEDIASRVGASSPTYTLPMGVGYSDGSKSASFVFRNAIVEYRPNVGKKSPGASKIPGKDTIYGVSYISIGIPQERYELMKSCLDDLYEIKLSEVEKASPKLSNGYYWITSNISANTEPMAYSHDGGKGMLQLSVLSLLSTDKRSILGNVTCTLSLKRVVEPTDVTRAISMSFKFVEILDCTDISSPPLSSTVAFIHDPQSGTSSAFRKTLQGYKDAQTSVSRPKPMTASNAQVPENPLKKG